MGGYEDDEFRLGDGILLVSEKIADYWNPYEPGEARAALGRVLIYQAAYDDGLAVLDGEAGLHGPLEEGRIVLAPHLNISRLLARLLCQFHGYQSAFVYVRGH